MSAADRIAQLAREYPGGDRRASLAAVVELRALLPLEAPPRAIGVVGTNGKTGTATYLARLLSARGRRTGLYTSPHLAEWGERVGVDDVPCDQRELLATLTEIRDLASSTRLAVGRDLRFFDLLTLAAELVFSRAGAEVGVFEAGIGGRLDAIAALRPRLLLLTSVALDHTEMLGTSRPEILREKLLAAPAGATVVGPPLGGELDELSEEIASERDLSLLRVEVGGSTASARSDLPNYLRLALALAEVGGEVAERILSLPSPPGTRGGERAGAIELDLAGRFERGMHDGVPYVLDAAHNEAGWRELSDELRRRFSGPDPSPLIALVSVSPDKEREGLPGSLRAMPGLTAVLATRHRELPAADPHDVAVELRRAAIEASAVEDVAEALSVAFERAAGSGGRVVVLGSTHLVGEVRRLLAMGAGARYE
jgi:dihydrofolate synthase / folylpolyglutamate synthase